MKPNGGPRLCCCGSKKESSPEFDARGIYLCRVCPSCRKEKLNKFRPEVLTDPNYECDEQVEADE